MDFLFGAFDTIGDDFELEDDYGEQHEESVEKDSESDMNESDSEDSDDSDDSNGHISPKLGLHAISLFRSLTRHEKKERFLMAFSEKIDRNSGKKERALQKMFKQVARVVDIQVKGRSVSAKSRMDTGADYNFITRDTVKRCGLDRTIKRNERSIALKLGDGTKTKVREKIELDWLFRQSDHIFQSTFFVLDDMPYDMIIGVGECVERGFITFNVPGKTFGALTSTLDSRQKAKLTDFGQLQKINKRERDKALKDIAQSLRSSKRLGSPLHPSYGFHELHPGRPGQDGRHGAQQPSTGTLSSSQYPYDPRHLYKSNTQQPHVGQQQVPTHEASFTQWTGYYSQTHAGGTPHYATNIECVHPTQPPRYIHDQELPNTRHARSPPTSPHTRRFQHASQLEQSPSSPSQRHNVEHFQVAQQPAYPPPPYINSLAHNKEHPRHVHHSQHAQPIGAILSVHHSQSPPSSRIAPRQGVTPEKQHYTAQQASPTPTSYGFQQSTPAQEAPSLNRYSAPLYSPFQQSPIPQHSPPIQQSPPLEQPTTAQRSLSYLPSSPYQRPPPGQQSPLPQHHSPVQDPPPSQEPSRAQNSPPARPPPPVNRPQPVWQPQHTNISEPGQYRRLSYALPDYNQPQALRQSHQHSQFGPRRQSDQSAQEGHSYEELRRFSLPVRQTTL